MAAGEVGVTILSDSSSDPEEEFLRHGYDIQSGDAAGVNLRAFPIRSAGAVTEETGSIRSRVGDPDRRARDLPRAANDEVDDAPDDDDDDDDSDDESIVLYEGERAHVTYEPSDRLFPDPMAREKSSALNEKKRDAIVSMVLVGVVAMLYGVGFPLYFADILLLNIHDVTAQRVCYPTMLGLSILSSMTSHVIVSAVGCRWTLLIGCFGASAFAVARFFSSTAFFVSSSVVCGLAAGPMFASAVTCALQLSRDYANLTGIDAKAAACYTIAFLNLCISLSPGVSSLLRLVFLPSEFPESFRAEYSAVDCFKHFCWSKGLGLAIYEDDEVSQRDVSEQFRLQALLGCFLSCSLGAASLVCLRWRHLVTASDTTKPEAPPASKWNSVKCSLKETTKMLSDNLMLLLMLLCVYTGVEQYLMYSIFLQTYTQCSSQMFHVFVLAMNLSLVSGLCSLPAAAMVLHFGRFKLLAPALATQLASIASLAACDQLHVPAQYVLAAFWGAADGVVQTATVAILVELFEERFGAALACHGGCQVVGYLAVVVLQALGACNLAILIAAICLLLTASLCYCVTEIRIRVRDDRPALRAQYVPLLDEASWLPSVNPVLVRRERRHLLSIKVPSFGHD